MAYNVNIDAYEGPLDLLLDLIDKNKIDIYDIPIHTVTEQFLNQIKQWEDMNLDIASDFILMAATLVEIKSKMLLPKEIIEIEGELIEIDPREELVKRLMEYKLYKEIADDLKLSEEIYSKMFFKPQEDVADYRDPFEELSSVNLSDLVTTLEAILDRNKYRFGIQNTFEISREKISLEECELNILSSLKESKSIKFSSLLVGIISRAIIIGYFLSVLELLRGGRIKVKQIDEFSDLLIERG